VAIKRPKRFDVFFEELDRLDQPRTSTLVELQSRSIAELGFSNVRVFLGRLLQGRPRPRSSGIDALVGETTALHVTGLIPR
jgi:hypothetical protein